jgi:hypothetical protein
MHRFVLLLVAFASASVELAGQSDYSVVRFDGIGAVRLGMSLRELNSALRTSYTRPTDPDEKSCSYFGVPGQSGISLMLLNGRVARVDIDNAITRTVKGIQNGDSESRAVQVYGKRLKVEPNHYIPESGHYLTLQSSNRKFGIRFESDDGKITRYYAGTAEAIAFIEGCS